MEGCVLRVGGVRGVRGVLKLVGERGVMGVAKDVALGGGAVKRVGDMDGGVDRRLCKGLGTALDMDEDEPGKSPKY
jgi:hypothetical protein